MKCVTLCFFKETQLLKTIINIIYIVLSILISHASSWPFFGVRILRLKFLNNRLLGLYVPLVAYIVIVISGTQKQKSYLVKQNSLRDFVTML